MVTLYVDKCFYINIVIVFKYSVDTAETTLSQRQKHFLLCTVCGFPKRLVFYVTPVAYKLMTHYISRFPIQTGILITNLQTL